MQSLFSLPKFPLVLTSYTGVVCLLQLMNYCVCVSHSVVSNSLQPHGLQPTRLLGPWDFPGKSTGVDCHFLLQEIVPTQGSNQYILHLLHWQAESFPLSHLRSPPWLISSYQSDVTECRVRRSTVNSGDVFMSKLQGLLHTTCKGFFHLYRDINQRENHLGASGIQMSTQKQLSQG